MILRVEIEHSIGDIVFLKTDIEQRPGMVTAIKINPNNLIQYEVSLGAQPALLVFGIEISQERDVILATQQ